MGWPLKRAVMGYKKALARTRTQGFNHSGLGLQADLRRWRIALNFDTFNAWCIYLCAVKPSYIKIKTQTTFSPFCFPPVQVTLIIMLSDTTYIPRLIWVLQTPKFSWSKTHSFDISNSSMGAFRNVQEGWRLSIKAYFFSIRGLPVCLITILLRKDFHN